MKGKRAVKQALQAEFKLDRAAKGPLFGVVSRLTAQKGMDLLLAALPELLQEGGQLVVLGTGDAEACGSGCLLLFYSANFWRAGWRPIERSRP